MKPSGTNRSAEPPAVAPVPEFPDCGAIVLVVDEDPSVRSAIVRLLERHGILAEGAAGERAAVRRVAELSHTLCAAMVDVSLRSESGLRLVRHLRRRHPSLPVLIFAAPDDHLGRRECLALGARACLAKPVPPDEIVRAVRGAIESRASRQSGPARGCGL